MDYDRSYQDSCNREIDRRFEMDDMWAENDEPENEDSDDSIPSNGKPGFYELQQAYIDSDEKEAEDGI